MKDIQFYAMLRLAVHRKAFLCMQLHSNDVMRLCQGQLLLGLVEGQLVVA